MPDFDVDFCIEKRQQVIDYVISKIRRRSRGADHHLRYHGGQGGDPRCGARHRHQSYQAVDRLAKMVPNELNITLDKALSRPGEFKTAYDTDLQAKELIDLARQLEGMPRKRRRMPPGWSLPAIRWIPMCRCKKTTKWSSPSIPWERSKNWGFLKWIFWGFETSRSFAPAKKKSADRTEFFGATNIPVDDAAVFGMLSAGESEGVFQLESERHPPGAAKSETAVFGRYHRGALPISSRADGLHSPLYCQQTASGTDHL